MLATHNPPAHPDRLPDSARRVKRQHPGARERLPEKAFDPTRLVRQPGDHLGAHAPNPLDIHRLLHRDEEHGDPQRWRMLRWRWDRIHSVRIVLDRAGFALVAAAVVWA